MHPSKGSGKVTGKVGSAATQTAWWYSQPPVGHSFAPKGGIPVPFSTTTTYYNYPDGTQGGEYSATHWTEESVGSSTGSAEYTLPRDHQPYGGPCGSKGEASSRQGVKKEGQQGEKASSSSS